VQEVRQDRLANSIRQVRSLLAANLIPAARPTLPKWEFGSHNELLSCAINSASVWWHRHIAMCMKIGTENFPNLAESLKRASTRPFADPRLAKVFRPIQPDDDRPHNAHRRKSKADMALGGLGPDDFAQGLLNPGELSLKISSKNANAKRPPIAKQRIDAMLLVGPNKSKGARPRRLRRRPLVWGGRSSASTCVRWTSTAAARFCRVRDHQLLLAPGHSRPAHACTHARTLSDMQHARARVPGHTQRLCRPRV
jgi:hypothetical protein